MRVSVIKEERKRSKAERDSACVCVRSLKREGARVFACVYLSERSKAFLALEIWRED